VLFDFLKRRNAEREAKRQAESSLFARNLQERLDRTARERAEKERLDKADKVERARREHRERTKTDRKASELFKRMEEKVREEVESEPEEDTGEILEQAQPWDDYSPQSEEYAFLKGEWISAPNSSHIVAFRYLVFDEQLEIEYKNEKRSGTTFYGYNPVGRSLAMGLLARKSNVWVWDNLRRRGTVFGFKIPYHILPAISSHEPLWHRAGEASRVRHGKIGPEGEPYPGWRPDKDKFPGEA
jgi:hypothetical protein